MKQEIIKKKLKYLMLITIALIIFYVFFDLNFANEKVLIYSLEKRIIKIIVMVIVAFCIGLASLIFQSIINNYIVTPCLLGMNSLYTLIHTMFVFILGSSNILVTNNNLIFVVDLTIMTIISLFIYYFLFKKVNYNIIYILLVGTLLTSFFTSIQNALVRVMDPNEYDSLLSKIVPSFNNINTNIIALAIILIILIIYFLKEEIKKLDVINLGKDIAINLGVDYNLELKKLLVGVVLLIAIATALVGPISFIGLIIANLSRTLLKTYHHKYLIIGSIFFGIIVLVASQVIVERMFNYSLPISVFISIGGGIYFLFLLIQQKKVM